ncbi:MAG: endonuclease/exonuclease/phosphatase family protein [Bacteroidales bacterium]|nr:endonuclease/exonuclease/phosphatase family protein [Bacteroidales bacterium]
MKKLQCLIFIAVIFVVSACTSKADTNLRYISYNIRNSRANDGDNSWMNRRNGTINMINAENPDIFGVQEAYIEQVKFMEDSLPDYGHVGVGRDDGNEGGEHMAVFYKKSRFTLVDNGDFWLSETPDEPTRGWDAACYRIVTWAKLKDNSSGKQFYVFNTHLDHIGKVAREQSILLLCNRIRQITNNTKAPVFLSGDFNSTIDNPIFDPLKDFMKESRNNPVMTDEKATYNGFDIASNNTPDHKIDYIFYRNAQSVGFKTLDGSYGVPYISDHYPIEADFTF